MVVPNSNNSPAYGAALSAIQLGGSVYGLIAIVVTAADVIVRVKSRAKNGVKSEQLKYGRGVKEESDRQNVLLGKCWQLPFCRKFVRERCPIYHAKRTCWKELVGCMCEEAIIRNSMENRPIPKDELLAAQMIPRNNKLTIAQKKERCRSCVIFNEHQRHKYKVYMPAVVLGYVAAYILLRVPLLAATEALLTAINKVVQASTLNRGGNFTPPHAFVEMLLAVFFVIALSYSMKILEFAIFRAKV
jgi:flagellar biogenesis protein FliO